jgi:5-formyltetrahydrofolate cyclo-ligase
VSASLERSDLRARLRTARSQLGASERFAAANALISTLEQLPEFIVDARIAGYWAVGGELPLNLVYAQLRSRAQNYCLPILGEGNTLNFATWEPGVNVRANRYGIPEPDCEPTQLLSPQKLDVVLVPLLGFDRRGNRLGSGGGYYDRSFAFLRDQQRPGHPLLVGIGYHFQEQSELASESWDVPLDFVATDRELIDCTVSNP